MQSNLATHIELRPNREGQVRAYIAGTDVRVQDIYVQAEVQGNTPDEVITALPHLTLGQVHAALSYFFDHREQILEEMRQDEVFVDRLKAATGPGPLQQKLARSDADRAISSG